MKKQKNSGKSLFNVILVFLLLLILGGTGYMIYDSSKESSFSGAGGSGGGTGGTTNNNSVNTSTNTNTSTNLNTKNTYYSEKYNYTFQEEFCFDIFNKSNCQSYTNWAYIESGTLYGTYAYTTYYAVINGYSCIFTLPGSTPTTEDEFFAVDWINYEFESSPVSMCCYVFGLYTDTTLGYLKDINGLTFYSGPVFEYSSSSDAITEILESNNVDLTSTISFEILIYEELDYKVGCLFSPISNKTTLSSVTIDGISYSEKYYFSVFNIFDVESHEITSGTFSETDSGNKFFTFTMNDFNCCLHFVSSGIDLPSDFYEFIATDISNYTTFDLYIMDTTNSLEEYYTINDNVASQITKYTAEESDLTWFGVDEFKSAIVEGTGVYKFDHFNKELPIYESLSTASYSLRNKSSDETTSTCSQTSTYEVCDSYEDDMGYTWGPIVRPDESE